jgi:PhnB protein
MKINPYLNFKGQCEEAFKFYERVLGGKITFMMTWGESPMADQCPAESRNKIMHATLEVGDQTLMGADGPPEQYQNPQGISVALHFKDAPEGERVFQALSENGNVLMPYQKTFWAPGFGMCIDRFGIPWMVNCEQ